MSDLFEERVIPVPAKSTGDIVTMAEELLDYFRPEHLVEPGQLDLKPLVKVEFPQELGIHFQPAEREALGDAEARTVPTGSFDDPVDVLLREDYWEDFESGGSLARRPRVTLAHELFHATAHANFVRAVRDASEDGASFNRKKRDDIKPYHDPEWQAFCFAGALLAPPVTVRKALRSGTNRLRELSRIYGISKAMMEKHLGRVDLLEHTTGG